MEPGEDEEVNPGIYGKSLTAYIAAELGSRGVEIESVIEEDFARLIMLHRKPFRLWVGCANEDNSTTSWQLFLSAEVGFLGWLRGARPAPAFTALKERVRIIVEAIPGVSQIQWHSQ